MEKIHYLLPQEGNFYKANLHCHTNLSDGYFTPEEMKIAYQIRGYQIVAYTDHRICVDHSDLNDTSFLALTGTELDDHTSSEESGWDQCCHICCIARTPGTRENMLQMEHGDVEAYNRTIEKLQKEGFIVHYNHPAWSAQPAGVYTALRGVSGFEVFNYDAETYGLEGNGLSQYALFLKSGQRAYPVAGDDNHNLSRFRRFVTDSFGAFTMIKAKKLTYESVISALDAGHVYGSTGPEVLEYTLQGEKLSVKCSPVSRVMLKSAKVGINRQNIIMPSDVITEATFDLSQVHGFAYILLIAQDGTCACTAPVFEEMWK